MIREKVTPVLAWLPARLGPPRTGSVVLTVFGDALAARGGEIALPSLLQLMARLGSNDGVVRTALSRLTAEGWLDRTRAGRTSFYRLAPRGIVESAAATVRIYGPLDRSWGGALRVVLADGDTDRAALEVSGYALIAPGVLIAPDCAPAPADALALVATAPPDTLQAVSGKAWPLTGLSAAYAEFLERYGEMDVPSDIAPEDAMALRTLLIHDYRRIVLRDPRLPAALLPPGWPGHAARASCASLYGVLIPGSEKWLDTVRNASGPLPRGPDASLRFSGADR